MIAIIGALSAEINQTKKDMEVEQSMSGSGWSLNVGMYVDKQILLAQSGVGKHCAEVCVRTVLDNFPVQTLISMGYGGALSSELNIGDLVVCKKFLKAEGALSQEAIHSDQDLVTIAANTMDRIPGTLHIGNCLTAGFLVTRPEDKRSMGMQYQSHVVDMESYWTARIAKNREIRLLGVRAISDTAHERMPPFDRLLDSEGNILLKAATRHFLRNPADLSVVARLYFNARKASASLTRFMRAFLQNLYN